MAGSSEAGISKIGAAVSKLGTEPLTFGMELEFNLIIHESEIPREKNPQDALVGCHLVRKALVEEGIPLFEIEEHIEVDLDHWVSMYELMGGAWRKPSSQPTNAEAFSKWTVKTDISVGLQEREIRRLPAGYRFYSVELKSRIFSLLQDDWVGEISRILDILHTKLNSETNGSSIRLIANQCTGLHVHIGRAATPQSPARFDVRTVKNLFQLVTAFERQIDALHPADRISSANAYTALFCQPPSRRFLKLRHFGNTQNPLLSPAMLQAGTPLTWCRTIEGVVERLTDLYLLTLNLKSSAYNFSPTTPMVAAWSADYEAARKWTIEFRQHAGTLDARAILAWLGVVVAALQFAATTPYARLRALIERRACDPAFAPRDLLATLGVPGEVVEFYSGTSARDAAALVEADAEEMEANADPAALDRRLEMGAAEGAGWARQLRDLLRLVKINRLAASACRRDTVVDKLRAGGYGNFAPDVRDRLLGAMVPVRPWAAVGSKVHELEDGEIDVEFAPEALEWSAAGSDRYPVGPVMPLGAMSLTDQASLGFGQIPELEEEGEYA